MPSVANGRSTIWPDNVVRPKQPYSPAVRAGDWVIAAGHVPRNFDVGLLPEAGGQTRNPYLHNPYELQTAVTYDLLQRTLKAAGTDFQSVVRVYEWLVAQPDQLAAAGAGVRSGRPDTTSTWPSLSVSQLGIQRLLPARVKVEIDVIAIDGPGEPQRFQLVDEEARVLASGVRKGDWLFCSSQGVTDFLGEPVATDTGDGVTTVTAPGVRPIREYHVGDAEIATERALDRVEALAEAAGSSLGRCVKASVYLQRPEDWHGMDRAWRRRFPNNPPARVAVPYARSPHRGSQVEVALKLVADDSTLPVRPIETSEAPEPLGHEPQAVKAGHMVFFSGQMAVDSSGNTPVELTRNSEFPFYGELPRIQMQYMLDNIAAICAAAGTTPQNLCRRQAFHHDLGWFAQSMSQWGSTFEPGTQPASTTIEIGAPLLAPDAHVLLDLIGWSPQAD